MSLPDGEDVLFSCACDVPDSGLGVFLSVGSHVGCSNGGRSVRFSTCDGGHVDSVLR